MCRNRRVIYQQQVTVYRIQEEILSVLLQNSIDLKLMSKINLLEKFRWQYILIIIIRELILNKENWLEMIWIDFNSIETSYELLFFFISDVEFLTIFHALKIYFEKFEKKRNIPIAIQNRKTDEQNHRPDLDRRGSDPGGFESVVRVKSVWRMMLSAQSRLRFSLFPNPNKKKKIRSILPWDKLASVDFMR